MVPTESTTIALTAALPERTLYDLSARNSIKLNEGNVQVDTRSVAPPAYRRRHHQLHGAKLQETCGTLAVWTLSEGVSS